MATLGPVQVFDTSVASINRALQEIVERLEGTPVLGATGHMVFPGGLVLQWGPIPSTDAGADATVTFSAAFPTACRQVYTTVTGTTAGAFAVNGTPTTTQAVLRNTSASTLTGSYLAVGD